MRQIRSQLAVRTQRFGTQGFLHRAYYNREDDAGADEERHHAEPQQREGAVERARVTFEGEGLVAKAGIACDQALQLGRAPGNDPAQRYGDQQHGPEIGEAVGPGAAFQAATNAAPVGAQEAISLSSVYSNADERDDADVDDDVDDG